MTFIYKKFLPAVLLLIVSTILFCLPGRTFNQVDLSFFGNLPIDKILHAIIFALLVFFFCRPIQFKGFLTSIVTKLYFLIAIIFVIYGVIIEFIQDWFIPNRSFEGYDILADAIGCFIGYYIAKYIAKKQVPPTTDELKQQAVDYAKEFINGK